MVFGVTVPICSGFSRGAYQARVLATMITQVPPPSCLLNFSKVLISAQVGLLRTGNNEQIQL